MATTVMSVPDDDSLHALLDTLAAIRAYAEDVPDRLRRADLG